MVISNKERNGEKTQNTQMKFLSKVTRNALVLDLT